jgi:branched-chain amino acid transport system ATP-binding protein
MLSVRNLVVRYGQAVAVNGASLEVPEGAWVAIVGANGAGKSSLLRAIAGLVAHVGEVRLAGRNLAGAPAWTRQRLGLGFVPEGRQLFGAMSVEENLRAGGYSCAALELRRGLDQAFAMFPRLGERRRQIAATLSGGEQQMLALARALVPGPRLLLIDEISWGLMPLLVAQVFERLQALHAGGLTILQVEQNTREALRHAGHAYVMATGSIVIDGPAKQIARDPRVVESYVGA